MKRIFLCALVAGVTLSVASCGGSQSKTEASDSIPPAQNESPALVGSWVEPIPGMNGEQGVKLEENGKAQSINMATLQYESWTLQGNTLVLAGKSLGNGTTIEFKDTLTVVSLTADSLIVAPNRGEGMERHYSRKQAE